MGGNGSISRALRIAETLAEIEEVEKELRAMDLDALPEKVRDLIERTLDLNEKIKAAARSE